MRFLLLLRGLVGLTYAGQLMASLAELARAHTGLAGARLAHLQRLVASWGPLADLCFADLLLFAPMEEAGDRFVVLGQIRPTTNQTVYRHDFVGTVVDEVDRPIVARAQRTGEIVEGEMNISPLHDRVRVLAIPVRWDGEVVAVCTRESTPSLGRQPGELEQIYVEVFTRFAEMIAAGTFPFAAEDTGPRRPPGWATAPSSSTSTGGSSTPRPTPCPPSTGWGCTPTPRACA